MSDDKNHPSEAPADRIEQARAERFGQLVSTLVGGERLPAAMTPEDRELIEVVSIIRAATGDVVLAPERAATLAREAVAAAQSGSASLSPAERDEKLPADAQDLAARRRSVARRSAPWVLTLTASAAAAILWISRPTPTATTANAEPATLSPNQRSRPADQVVGMIARSDAHLASRRIDAIYADRLEGYRSLRLSAALRRGGTRD